MKKVLILSDQDTTTFRLQDLYAALFLNEKKKLYLCTINIMECHKMDGIYYKSQKHFPHSTLTVSAPPKLSNMLRPFKSFQASSCSQILEIIQKHKIQVLLIPNYIYDLQRTAQYIQIVKELRRQSNIEIVGLYI